MSSKCYSNYLHIKNLVDGKRVDLFVPSRCKSWGCPSCRSIKAKVVANFIKKSFKGQKVWMLTFTDPHKGEVIDAWKNLGPNWNRFRTWATKTYGKFQYIRVIEPHIKGGWPHMHVLVNVEMNESKIRQMLGQWNYGYIFDMGEKSPGHAANYLSKYLTKEWPGGVANALRSSTKTRIVQASQSLGAIFYKKTSWKIVSYKIPVEEVSEFVFEHLKEVWINHNNGAKLLKGEEFFLIESSPTKAFLEEFRELAKTGDSAVKEDLIITDNFIDAVPIVLTFAP